MNTADTELPIATSDGLFVAHYSPKGLSALNFPNANGLVSPSPRHRAVNSRSISPQILAWHRLTTVALKNALAGRPIKKLPPLDWTGTTEFQQAVWRAMLKLGPGKTLSYGEIAGKIGNPRAVRAVGGACGANSIPVLVPCHRVLAANGRIGGFSSGLDWKRKLLAREGLTFPA
jgi:O-6-methylguanine DNA methyltransferase